jgi:hypothetical protein
VPIRKSKIPNPGSKAAIKKGCTCPIIDNGHGRGWGYEEEKVFIMNKGCPVHDPIKEVKK